MSLPKRHLKSTRGQILILFLLVLVVGSAIVLSVASRTVTDIRTTTTSDESNRAYYAAEAGIEEALQKLQGGGSIGTISTNFQATVQAQASTKDVTDPAGTSDFVYPSDVEKDDAAQVMLVRDIFDADHNGIPDDADHNGIPDKGNGVIDLADITGGGSWTGSSLIFFWGESSTIDDTTPAIEVSVVYADAAGNFSISKMAFDPKSSRLNPNKFCNQQSGVDVAGPFGVEGKNFFFKTTVNITGGGETCATGLNNQGKSPVLARIRTLYNSSPIAVASGSAGVNLPPQGTTLESTGYTSSGVTRKLQVIRLYPALPALFDYVLFNGSSTNPLSR